MSESYISDSVAIYRGDAKSEAKNQWFSGSWIDKVKSDIGLSSSGLKADKNVIRRINYSVMTPIDIFKDTLIKSIEQKKVSLKEEEFNDIVNIALMMDDLEFRNILAIAYGYKYGNINDEKELSTLLKEAINNDIQPFDVIRYNRFIKQYINIGPYKDNIIPINIGDISKQKEEAGKKAKIVDKFGKDIQPAKPKRGRKKKT